MPQEPVLQQLILLKVRTVPVVIALDGGDGGQDVQ